MTATATTVQAPVAKAAATMRAALTPVTSEGCDSCGVSATTGLNGLAKPVAQAQVRVTFEGLIEGRPLVLTFCKHHANEHAKSANFALLNPHVEDVSEGINSAPSPSANI